MTPDELNKVAIELGLALPAFYRYYLHSSRDDPRMRQLVEYNELYDVPELLLDANKFVRRSGEEWTADGGPWPSQYLIIGAIDNGEAYEDFWAIDTTNDAPLVWEYEYDRGSFEIKFLSFDQFITERARHHDEAADR